MDILEEILKAKDEYIKREKGLQEELKALNDTKSVYEKSGKSSLDSYKNIIADLTKKINEYEILLQKCIERRKEIAQKITTIKSSNTKISKKEKLISDRIQEIAMKINSGEENQNKEEIDNSVIQNLASLIEILKEYKKQGIISIPTIDTLETELSKLDNESLKNLKQQMQSAIRIIKGAVKAKSNAIEKFNVLMEPKKVNVKKVNDAQSKKAKSKAAVSETTKKVKSNAAGATQKHKSAKTIKVKTHETNENLESNATSVIPSIIEENNTNSNEKEEIKIDEDIRKIIEKEVDIPALKAKSLDEIIKIAEDIKANLCNNGYMLHLADEAFRYIIIISGKNDEYRKREQETFDVWSNVPGYTNNTIESIITEEESSKQGIQENSKPSESIENIILTGDSKYEGAESNISEEDNSSETLAIEDDTKPVSEEVVWFDGKSTEEPIMQSKKVKNMLLKNIAINNNKNVKSCCIIKIMEGKQKVEVDGKEIELNRHLDIETENKVDKICKRFIHINENPTNEQTNELKRLKKYIDPAVVNAIKDSLFSKSNLDRWNRAITKVKNLKYSNRINERIKKLQQEEIDEIALKIIEENNQAVDEYYMAKKIYAETLTEYIKSVYMADKTDMLFLPFGDLVYECPRNMSTREYNKIDNYLKAAENIGGRVFGKRSFFGLIKEKIVKNKNISFERENLQQKENKEGDKSFVEKVETSEKIDEEQNSGSVTFSSSFRPKKTERRFIGSLTLE